MATTGKIIILSAPSGTGKSTIIRRLSSYEDLHLGFSISATSRKPRAEEKDGREYYFKSEKEFRRLIRNDEFVEWEEVYAGNFYGTLKSEIKRVTSTGHNIIMDIDVKGALNVKKLYGGNALAIFLSPPSLKTLAERLRNRASDDEEAICKRLEKAEYEMGFAPDFDKVIVNDNLDKAVEDTRKAIYDFINCPKN